MGQPKHTPGPWRLHGELINSNKCEIAEVINYKSNGESGANALLIAAAPELLAWTVELLKQLKIDHPTNMDGIKQHVEALIKRAGGAE